MENLRGDQIKSRKGQVELDKNVAMRKNDSKNVSHYERNVPSYRWPKKLFQNDNAEKNIENLFFKECSDEIALDNERLSIPKGGLKSFK